MSYNYLPLDRKWLHFQQVKNLLDYDQLVSITFDAHERILKCREYLDNITPYDTPVSTHVDELRIEPLKTDAVDIKEEVPEDIVKLMLMLKVKSLSYGQTAVQIDTVKRLMEMYNNRVYPVIYNQTSSPEENVNALSQLCRTLIGLGTVNYKGEKTGASSVLKELNWQPVSLKIGEVGALTTGTHCTTAFALYALKKVEQLLNFADILATLSFSMLDAGSHLSLERIRHLGKHKGQKDTAANILKYLTINTTTSEQKGALDYTFSFSNTLQVHGTAKDVFEHVLNIFLKEINSVTDTPVILPDEGLVVDANASAELPLVFALDYLTAAMSAIASISESRTNLLIADRGDGYPFASASAGLQLAAATTTAEIKRLSTPSSVNYQQDFGGKSLVNRGQSAGQKSVTIINNVEIILAIELIAAAQASEINRTDNRSPILNKLVFQFHRQLPQTRDSSVSSAEIAKATEFIRLYKFD